jgi:hypothetical protein
VWQTSYFFVSVWVIYTEMPNSVNKLDTQINPVMKAGLSCKCCWILHVTKSWSLHNQFYPATCLALLCHYKRSRHLILICAMSMGLVYQTGQKTKDGGSDQQAASLLLLEKANHGLLKLKGSILTLNRVLVVGTVNISSLL